jgi:hypothetical protein
MRKRNADGSEKSRAAHQHAFCHVSNSYPAPLQVKNILTFTYHLITPTRGINCLLGWAERSLFTGYARLIDSLPFKVEREAPRSKRRAFGQPMDRCLLLRGAKKPGLKCCRPSRSG